MMQSVAITVATAVARGERARSNNSSAAAAIRPADGRYISRSAMMVPVVTIRLEAGSHVMAANVTKKNAARCTCRNQIAIAAPAITARAAMIDHGAMSIGI